jgi:hypothetical protein
MERTRELIEKVLKQSNDGITGDDITAIAEQGVNYIVYSSLTDPGNEEQIVKGLGESKHGICPFSLNSDSRFLLWTFEVHWSSQVNLYFPSQILTVGHHCHLISGETTSDMYSLAHQGQWTPLQNSCRK